MLPTNLRRLKSAHSSRAFIAPSGAPAVQRVAIYAISKFYTPDVVTSIKEDFKRSTFTPDAVIDDFHRADIPQFNVVKDDTYYNALDAVETLLAPKVKLRPVHINDVIEHYPWNTNTSAEAPFTTDPRAADYLRTQYYAQKISNRRYTFANLFSFMIPFIKIWIHHIKDGLAKGGKYFFWCTAHARSHLVAQNDPDKIRMVYGIPKLLIFIECMFLWPYFVWLKNNQTPLAWGYESLNGGIYRLYATIFATSSAPTLFLCVDWSKFDKYIYFSVLDDIHSRWYKFIDFDNGYWPTYAHPHSTTDPQRLLNLWDWMRNAVKFMPIRLSTGEEWQRLFASFGSGLFQTQIGDSWYNLLIIITVLLEMGFTIEQIIAFILGDDSLIGLRTDRDLDPEQFLAEFAAIALRRFNMTMSLSKSIATLTLQQCEFLGYKFNYSIPNRDEHRLLAILCHPERNTDIHRLAARAIGVAWASAGQYEKVYLVCKDVYEYCMSVGAQPDPIGYDFLNYMSTIAHIDISSFPEISEIQSACLNPHGSDPSVLRRYWNSDHFMPL